MPVTAPVSLQIQALGGFSEQVLVLLHIAELRDSSRSASPAQIAELFRALRLPPPTNERQHLLQLRRRRLVMQPAPGRWALTPSGKEEIRRLMGDTAPVEFVRLGQDAREPFFAGAAHHLIPHEIAPAQFQPGISRFLEGHPFERNVFCITRYPDEDGDLVTRTIGASRDVCAEFGLELHLASDRAVDDLLFGNVGSYMWASQYGIVVLEDRVGRGLNYNVVLETGAMLMAGRRCLLIKDRSVPSLPTDLMGHIYKAVDLDQINTVEIAVREWASADLGLGNQFPS